MDLQFTKRDGAEGLNVSRQPTWVDTLDHYLASSNEDEQIASFFKEVVVDIVQNVLGRNMIRWIDVGTGIGAKTLAFAETLASRVGRESIALTMVDPFFRSHCIAVEDLREAVVTRVGLVRLVAAGLEEYLGRGGGNSVAATNLVSCIHMAYSSRLVGEIDKLINVLDTARSAVVFAVCESEESDFSRLRIALAREGVPVPRSFLHEVARSLDRRGFALHRYSIGGQRCQIDRHALQQDDCHWLFPFLVGRQRDEFTSSDRRFREVVLRVTRQYVDSRPSGDLIVPDEALIAISTGSSTV